MSLKRTHAGGEMGDHKKHHKKEHGSSAKGAEVGDHAVGPESPFVPMFRKFRADLDAHTDRRERIVKASRDVTAASKKM